MTELTRRAVLAAATAAPLSAAMAAPRRARSPIRKIATEEGFSVPELIDAIDLYMKDHGDDEPGLRALIGTGKYPRMPRLLDPALRIADMDRADVDMQVLLVNSPGVQIFEPRQGAELAILINDRAADWQRRWPTKFAPLAAVAPQDPLAAARELERAVRTLGLHGAVINSHTKGQYLDDRRFWPIFEAAQSLDVPIYIHPREPAPAMLPAYRSAVLEGAIWGYAAETSLHALRLIMAGVFDEFPRLKIVIGHNGEGIPFYLDRLDNRYRTMHGGGLGKLRLAPSQYFRQNFWITTSGANWPPAVEFCQRVLGPDRVLFAVDYPFEEGPSTVAQANTIAMSDADRRKFFHRNAETVFGIAPHD